MVDLDNSTVRSEKRESRGSSKRLLVTKLRAPRAAPDDLVRTRLLDEIERGADRKLTLLVSPPGYGKSTILSRWQSQSERATGWLSLDPADNDIHLFMDYLVAAIQSIDREICQESASAVRASSPLPGQHLVRLLLNDIAESTRPFVLILDDFHELTSPEVQSAVLQIIQGMPANMSIVIASRHEPDLPTLQMTARGELMEFGFEELSFSREETEEFLLGRQGLELTTADVTAIADWAEGWPVALRLIARVLQGRTANQTRTLLESLSVNVPLVSDYLWDEVLENTLPEQRAFLLRTSILDQFNPELAAVVTGIEASPQLLAGLARDNLFIIRLGGTGNWHRYHHLFAEVLRKRLEEEMSEACLQTLHARAVDWYETNEMFSDAATHSIAARDWTRAARHLVTVCEEFYAQERIGSLRAWLGGLPDEPLVLEPKLAYWLAWALMRSGRMREAARPIRIASAALSSRNETDADQTALQLDVLRSIFEWDTAAGLARTRSLLAALDPAQTANRARAQIMLALLQETGGDLIDAASSLEEARVLTGRSGVRGLHVLELNATGGLLLAMGKLHEPAELFRRIISIGDVWNDLPLQNAHHQLGVIMLEWLRKDEARALALASIEISRMVGTPIHLPGAHALLSALATVDEAWDLALDEIERAIAYCAAAEAWGPLRVFEEKQCRIWLAMGQLTFAQRWLHQIGPGELESDRYEDLAKTLTVLRVRIHEGRGPEIIPRLEHLEAIARARSWNRELISIHSLRAIAALELGDSGAAQTAIDAALELGSTEGFMRTYLREGLRIRPVLRLAARKDGPQRNHAIAVLTAAGEVVAEPVTTTVDAPSILSNRERDVMRLVANGLSNRAVGDTLFISEETVKTHLRRIFEKLEVSSRTQAINKARQLDLLP